MATGLIAHSGVPAAAPLGNFEGPRLVETLRGAQWCYLASREASGFLGFWTRGGASGPLGRCGLRPA